MENLSPELNFDKPVPMLELVGRRDCERLHGYLHNENGPYDYVMGFRDKKDVKTYVRAKTRLVSIAINWGLQTMAKCGGNAKPLAFTPYAISGLGLSRWGAFDFDAHDGNYARARRFAEAALKIALTLSSVVVLLEDTGRGYHLWIISKEFLTVDCWHSTLNGIAREIGATVRASECEVFPACAKPAKGSLGMALRAPGSWNPATKAVNLVVWHNLNPLLLGLAGEELRLKQQQGEERKSFYLLGEVSERSTQQSVELYRGIGGRWARDFAITLPHTRHESLLKLTGEMFFQVGQVVAEENARRQYRESTVVMEATEELHLAEFADMWTRSLERWRIELSAQEREKYGELCTDNERDAFRIVRSFHRLAALKKEDDFKIVCEHLALRLKLSRKGAGGIRDKFVLLGVLAQTAPYVPRKYAARFRWLLRA